MGWLSRRCRWPFEVCRNRADVVVTYTYPGVAEPIEDRMCQRHLMALVLGSVELGAKGIRSKVLRIIDVETGVEVSPEPLESLFRPLTEPTERKCSIHGERMAVASCRWCQGEEEP